MARTTYFALSGAAPLESTCVMLPDDATVPALCEAVVKDHKALFPLGVRASALMAFADSNAPTPLPIGASLGSCGLSEDSPLILQIPQTWVQLVGAGTWRPVKRVLAVPLLAKDDIGMLKNLLCFKTPGRDRYLLDVYANKAAYDTGKALEDSDKVATHGHDKSDPLIVVDPVLLISSKLPLTAPLPAQEGFKQECDLTEWERGSVHKIPLIWEFMKALGGCTSNGIVFWRMEDRLLVSLLVRCWFQESEAGDFAKYKDKRAIVLGSPGVGKSVITCVMAFYLALVRKKNVLLYRTSDAGEYLLYLKYDTENGSVAHFTVEEEQCDEKKAVSIYRALCEKHGKRNVWLLLDGFILNDVPTPLKRFRMLATSLQVQPKAFQSESMRFWLLSSWNEPDIFSLGKLVYGFDETEIARRYFFSGGNAWYFGLPSVGDIKDEIDDILCTSVTKSNELFSSRYVGWSGTGQMNRLRRTFLKLNLGLRASSKELVREFHAGESEEKRIDEKLQGTRELDCLGSLAEWGHAVDSLYAVQKLADNFSEDKLIECYNWANSASRPSLAAGLYEIYMYRMASENNLKLVVSVFQSSSQERDRSFTPLEIPEGSPVRGDSAAHEYTGAKLLLERWRDDTKSTYWSAGYHHVHAIDAIVKLAPTSGKTSTVAYLDVVTDTSHVVDTGKLLELNNIFCQGSESTGGTPVYVALCPNESACKALSLKPHDQVVAAQTMCRVCVGYCPTLLATSMPPSRGKRSLSESKLCSEPRKQQKTSG